MNTEQMKALLRECQTKLTLYRGQHSGEYIGGVEFAILNKRIDAALSEDFAVVSPLFGECICPTCGIRHGSSNTSTDF